MLNKKTAFLFIVIVVYFLYSCANNEQAQKTIESETTIVDKQPETGYDSLLAQRLGADAYGMRQYVMAFLKKGPNRPEDPEEAKRLQTKHLENIGKLAEEGKLVVAGPFLDDGELRGIYIFNVKTIEEAEMLTNTDPAIQSGSLVMELHPWYGSAALVDVNTIHNKIKK
ncbi:MULTISPECIES: YciI family protein [unclassified Aureispira]|uniref:YciI family protein n=1 Tax=unclassified Aureispira TaxID=2649989 RepID=UPI00069841F1|nr:MULTISPECIES: YciI family protein [unclassified Aureispira]WMX12215.1 YciI family protein [Aureispira sp. CCB-E]